MDNLNDLPKQFLSITFDQLRTLLYVVKEGSPHKASLALGREQSSVVKQIERLDESFQHLCGEPLVIKRGRGEDYAPTETGKSVAALTVKFLNEWGEYLEGRRREVGKRLVIATTTFTVSILAQLWDDVSTHVAQHTELQVRQIHTKDFLDALEDRSVDLIIGGALAVEGKLPLANGYEFAEWGREGICFLTNLAVRSFPGEAITLEELRRHPLILPEAGIITEAIRTWYGNEYWQKLILQPQILDVHYAKELLLTGIVEGFMVATSTVAALATPDIPNSDSQRADTRRSGLRKLRAIKLGAGFQPLEIINGLFGRKGERAMYESLDMLHPLALFWETFEQYARCAQRVTP